MEMIHGYTDGEFADELAPELALLEVFSKEVNGSRPCAVVMLEREGDKVYTQRQMDAVVLEFSALLQKATCSAYVRDQVRKIILKHDLQ
jgi:uncharacterized protein GlcG (DUF336 family)